MSREWFEMNYVETARVLNDYAQICKIYNSDLDSPYNVWKSKNVAVARRLMPLLEDFIVRVPEGIREYLTISPEKIKKRCLEILADEIKE